ncbi:MAG: hypothetical protein II388_05395 [Clostridia bacterium]|nr:hypothetical protein [Clostridia bacterium]
MMTMRALVEGPAIAEYRKGKFTLTCKISNGFYCVTFHNGRQSVNTFYSKNKNEMNDFIRKEVKDGFKRVF